MLKSHEKFHSKNGKRLLLIADDELVNREILRSVLESDYELVFAEDGAEALREARRSKDVLSLIMLDLMMPVMDGIEALRAIRADEDLASIPVIVATSDQEAEVTCLTIGANDFISKPYPQPSVVLARVQRAIELNEDRLIINSTERDELTGLYNREFFYRYAEQFDRHHTDLAMDAVIVDINHFHHINERFGSAYGDEVLRRVGERLRASYSQAGGIVCRREADTFMAYCPHGNDHARTLEQASEAIAYGGDAHARMWLRMGVYEDVDKSMEIERRFDRAQMASDSVRGSFARTVGTYDATLHERELFHEQLIDDFDAAIRERQFIVVFQPKYDIQSGSPVMVSAEALVRWDHPTLGMVSPGDFVPLFEENGLVQQLDTYVWRETCHRIARWKERFAVSVPVSVNVSRVDMYDPHLPEALVGLLEDDGLTTDDLLLEITESAYTQDADQMITMVRGLRDLGFKVEMDDFGTGYSSLSMISNLPIDALKIDMQFVSSAFEEGGDTRLIEIILDIADYLNVPVIAEGVETKAQMLALRDLGCDRAQGYYFSKPLPAGLFEELLVQEGNQGAALRASFTPSRTIAPRRRRRVRNDVSEEARP